MFNQSDVDLTWNLVKAHNSSMEFKLLFKKPTSVSMSTVQDQLVIVFSRSYWKVSNRQSYETILTNESRIIKHKIRKQMLLDNFSTNFIDLTERLKVFMFVLLVTVVVLSKIPMQSSSSSHLFILFVRALAITVHMPMLQIIIPGNVLTFFSIIIKVVMFDVLEESRFWENQKALQFAENLEFEMIDQMQNAGYDSGSELLLLQTLAIVILVYWS